MYKIVKKEDCNVKIVNENQTVHNYITGEISPAVSLIVVENTKSDYEYKTDYHRIYYVLSGEMNIEIEEKSEVLHAGDVCYIEKGMSYRSYGTYTVLVVNQPAKIVSKK